MSKARNHAKRTTKFHNMFSMKHRSVAVQKTKALPFKLRDNLLNKSTHGDCISAMRLFIRKKKNKGENKDVCLGSKEHRVRKATFANWTGYIRNLGR